MTDLTHIDAKTRRVLDRAVAELKTRYGPDLTGAILYGSATGPEFLAGRSDLNLLVLLARVPLAALQAAREFSRAWRRHRIRPLLMSPADVHRSLDVFPIEMLEIQAAHVTLYGDDPFGELRVRPADLRRQCECEFKRHVMRFRHAFIGGDGAADPARLLTESITGLVPLLRAFSRVAGGPSTPATRSETVMRAAQAAGFDPEPVLKVLELKRGGRRLSRADLSALAGAYLDQLERVVDATDRLPIGD
ncbi:MAG: hypothetical protein ABIO65_02000 [Nitrospiria bacterium]